MKSTSSKDESPMRVSSTGLDLTNSAPTPNTFRLPSQSPKLYKDNFGSGDVSPERKSSISLMKQRPELRDKFDFNTVKGIYSILVILRCICSNIPSLLRWSGIICLVQISNL